MRRRVERGFVARDPGPEEARRRPGPEDPGRRPYLQAVVQGEVLEALACSHQQGAAALCLSGAGRPGVPHRCLLKIFSDTDKVLPGLAQLGQEPETDPDLLA